VRIASEAEIVFRVAITLVGAVLVALGAWLGWPLWSLQKEGTPLTASIGRVRLTVGVLLAFLGFLLFLAGVGGGIID
jgi:hypothetical protein